MKSCPSKKKGKSFVKGQCPLKAIWKRHRNCLLSAPPIFLEYEPVMTCLLNHSTEVWRYCLPSSTSNCFGSWTKHTSLSHNNSELKGDFKSLCVTLLSYQQVRTLGKPHWTAMQAHELFRNLRMPELVDVRQYVRTLPTNTLMGFGAFAALTTYWYATRPKALKPACDLAMQSVEVEVSVTWWVLLFSEFLSLRQHWERLNTDLLKSVSKLALCGEYISGHFFSPEICLELIFFGFLSLKTNLRVEV